MSRDKLLFTPGPLTTSDEVKRAMLRDLGSRDPEFIGVVREIRSELLSLCGPGASEYEAIPMQGSGTFAIEAVLSSAIPASGKLLLLINGAYGRRMRQIAVTHELDYEAIEFAENERVLPERLEEALADDHSVTHVAAVHCETTTGILNQVEKLGPIAHAHGCAYIVDAMSSFGGVPLDVAAAGIDFLVSSANKCIEGVPGFGFVIARRAQLMRAKGEARTVSLDLYDQWRGLESNGQFRFTPPTHALLAFRQALAELKAEGGVTARAARYRENHRTLIRGMRALGFETYLRDEDQSWIITSFRYPAGRAFSFEAFYSALSERGFVIYPGKLSREDCFRIGTIGRIGKTDIEALLAAIAEVL
jgi:2-aminoethylphosphonate-pyruvate transaminase